LDIGSPAPGACAGEQGQTDIGALNFATLSFDTLSFDTLDKANTKQDWDALVDLTNMRVSVAAAGLPGRYAAALFDLAQGAKSLDATAADLAQLKAALGESAEFRSLITSQGISRADAGKAVAALGSAMGLSDLVTRFLGVLAQNGRLGVLADIIRQYELMLSAHKGSTTAQVTAAHKLTAAQKKALEAKLKARTGRQMDVDVTVDPSILGGLVVRIGSEQIDSSIRTRLTRLGQQMKGQ
jgi:F-type H+-transporting ATPase subunit delta